METAFPPFVVPGTFVRVRAEGLISVGGISTGNIGIVGTAGEGLGETHLLSDFGTGQERFGDYDASAADGTGGTLNLTRSLEILFRNGARTVYARGVATGTDQAGFGDAFNELVKDDVNILLVPELTTTTALAVLGPVLETAENQSKDLIALVGSDQAASADITGQVQTNDRIVLCAPGIRVFDRAAGDNVDLNGRYTAAAIGGLISTLPPQLSPTNKVLPGVNRLATRFSYGELTDLVSGRVCVLEQRQGVRVVRGVTTDDGAFIQITTRRIVDFAKAGVRAASDPFIGRLNNERVRKALSGAIDGFLTTMVVNEQLIDYDLQVTATRDDEIAGRAVVNAILRPTFSIDYIAVTLVLE